MPEFSPHTEHRLREAYPYHFDLSNCDIEPLHHIQLIQSHACVFGVDAKSLTVGHVSSNVEEFTGVLNDQVLGQSLANLYDAEVIAAIRSGIERESFEAINPIPSYRNVGDHVEASQLIVNILEHGRLLVEVERPAPEFHTSNVQLQLGRAIEAIQRLDDYDRMFEHTVDIVRKVAGYDRVMMYRFDPDWNGQIIAESRREDLEPFLHLRYPAGDIPQTARALYFKNRIRMIGDVLGESARLVHAPGVPTHDVLDLTQAGSRGMSPVHGEYLAGMGVKATMSLAIIVDHKLWGLFAMHHYSGPRVLDYEMRNFLEFLGRVFSGHLALQQASEYRRRILEVNVLRSQLGDQISDTQDLASALIGGSVSVSDLIPDTHGTAVSVEGELRTTGHSLSEDQIHELVTWIAEQSDDPLSYHTDNLSEVFPPAMAYRDTACGVLLVWLARERREYVLWMRQEIVRHIDWGGNPHKNKVATSDGGHRLAPRTSFAKYTELVKGRSEPWTESNIDAALALRNHIKDVVMRRYQQVKRVNSDLASAYREMETFSYTVSHDLRAPLRGISGFAEILLEDYGEQLDDDGRMMLRSIQANTGRMNVFINELLELSKVGASSLSLQEVSMKDTVRLKFEELRASYPERNFRLQLEPLVEVIQADPVLLNVLLNNILGNAIKYTIDSDPAVVTVGVYDQPHHSGHTIFYVQDNGIGFDQAHAERAFEMFSRITNDTRIEGSGVGLALVQRVVEKHGGVVWADSEPGQGATFYFSLGS